MSTLIDILVGFIATMLSAALVHFGATDTSAPRRHETHDTKPAHQTLPAKTESSEHSSVSESSVTEVRGSEERAAFASPAAPARPAKPEPVA